MRYGEENYVPAEIIGSEAASYRRWTAGLKQTEVAERLSVSQSAISQAEKGDSRALGVAKRILAIGGYVVDDVPLYYMPRRRWQHFAGRPLYESLGYHLRVLYIIRRRAALRNNWFSLLSEFEARTEGPLTVIETDRLRVCFRRISEGAKAAIEDLLRAELVSVEVVHQRSEKPIVRDMRGRYITDELDPGLREYADRQHAAWVTSQHEYQEPGCWVINDAGEREDLSGALARFTFSVTEKGEQVWTLLGPLIDKLDEEDRIETAREEGNPASGTPS